MQLCNQVAADTSYITFSLINARSICNKATLLNDTFTDLKCDFICITESWLAGNSSDDPIINDVTPSGFVFSHNAREQRRGGGVAILCRSSLKAKRLDQPFYTSFEHMTLQFPCTNGSISIYLVYRPPSTSKYTPYKNFLDEFTLLLNGIISKSSRFIILGDFNTHFDATPSTTVKLKELLQSFGLHQHVHKPTHARGGILDLAITKPEELTIFNVTCTDLHISDHYVVTGTIQYNGSLHDHGSGSNTLLVWSRRNLIMTDLALDLKLACDDITISDLASAVSTYNRKLFEVYDKHAPLKLIKLRTNGRPFSMNIQSLKQAKRRA